MRAAAKTPGEKRVPWWLEAQVAMMAGQKDATFEALDQALAEKRSFTVNYLRNSRFFAPLREDPRFPALLAKHSAGSPPTATSPSPSPSTSTSTPTP